MNSPASGCSAVPLPTNIPMNEPNPPPRSKPGANEVRSSAAGDSAAASLGGVEALSPNKLGHTGATQLWLVGGDSGGAACATPEPMNSAATGALKTIPAPPITAAAKGRACFPDLCEPVPR